MILLTVFIFFRLFLLHITFLLMLFILDLIWTEFDLIILQTNTLLISYMEIIGNVELLIWLFKYNLINMIN